MSTVISVENLSKSYRLGQIGTGTLSRDLEIWLAKLRGKPNPYLKIGQSDPGELNGETLWALKDISFQVQQGEVLGIIGRNGAGKSTLLKILSRVTAPTSGQVKVRGRIASLLEVGTGFHPELTGRENIFLNGAILGMSKQEVQRKFDEIVSFAEVEKFVDTPVKRYSSGMYVRLAFAVAAHLESEILLVDEVLAVGDAEFQKKCLGKMGDVATNEGRTVLFVSHNMGAVKLLCNLGILIEKGELNYSGEITKLVENYLIQNTLVENNEYSRPRKDCTSKIVLKNLLVEPPIRFNESLNLKFEFILNEIIEYFTVEWFMKDIYGQRILSGLSVLSDKTWFIPKSKKGTISCKVSNWRFPGGQYTISVIFTNKFKECYDYVENAVTFVVNSQSIDGSNFVFTNKYGFFLPEVVWAAIENTEMRKD